jgi:ABC-type molybdate transport system substrate-binding protein
MAVALVSVGCGTGGGDRPAASTRPQPQANGFITIVASDLIAPALRREVRAFRAVNRLASVTVQAGASSTIAGDLLRGRVTDLYVSAGTADMDRVVDAELVYGAPMRFARGPRSSATPVPFSIVLMNTTGDQITSRVFMRFLTTAKGREILEVAGFRPLS